MISWHIFMHLEENYPLFWNFCDCLYLNACSCCFLFTTLCSVQWPAADFLAGLAFILITYPTLSKLKSPKKFCRKLEIIVKLMWEQESANFYARTLATSSTACPAIVLNVIFSSTRTARVSVREEDFHLSDRRLSSLTSALTRPSLRRRLPNADCVRVRVYVTVQLHH